MSDLLVSALRGDADQLRTLNIVLSKRIGRAADEIERLARRAKDMEEALERIAGGDGYYPELAMAKLTAIRSKA